MAVLVEAVSVIIKASAIQEKYPGGWKKFKANLPNRTMCTDGELIRVGFMVPGDARAFVRELESFGFVSLVNNSAQDIATVSQSYGLTTPCPWIELLEVTLHGNPPKSVMACRLVGSNMQEVVFPENWKFEDSMSDMTIIDLNDQDNGMIFYEHKDSVDVYVDRRTGKKLYVGRTQPR
jgi:hypothetical protein